MSDIRESMQKLRKNLNLTVIVSAVLLLELMMGFMFYSAQNFIQRTMERMVNVEMNAIYLCIRNKLMKAEVTIDNMSWVVGEALNEPDWMFDITRRIVKNNTLFWGSGIAFVPNYYPAKGQYFEPYSARRGGDTIVSIQVAKEQGKYLEKEYYQAPLATGKSLWTEPYADHVEINGMTTTYSAPVRDASKRIVGVIFADIPLRILEDIMNEEKVYQSTQRFLVTGEYNLLAGKNSPLFREVLPLLKKDKDKEDYFMMKSKDGHEYHIFYTPVGGNTDWVLINVLDDNEVFGRLRMMRMMLMLPVVLGLVFAGLIVWRSSKNLKRLKKVNAEKERIDGELRVASEIQQSMLPQGELCVEGLELKGMLKPARQVGGDLYDYYIRDEKLFFCIGDVSGKGAAAAMLMGVIHSLFRSASAHENNPARVMQTINETSCQNNESNMFVTLFIGVLDLPTGLLRYCDAGHDAPFVLHGTTSTLLPVKPHLPVGVFEDMKYDVQTATILPDSTIFLYTDGLTEAKNTARKQFGIERVKDLMEGFVNESPQEMLEKIVAAVERFVKNAEQSDDLTMLAVRYVPVAFESTLSRELTIKNDVHEVAEFSRFIKSVNEELGLETSLARQIRLAVEEAVVNVIDYAYPEGVEGDITVQVLSDGRVMHVKIIDSGVPFDPTEIQKADTTLSAEDRRIGGLGILLVREQMDSINYERTDGKNVLTLMKKLK